MTIDLLIFHDVSPLWILLEISRFLTCEERSIHQQVHLEMELGRKFIIPLSDEIRET